MSTCKITYNGNDISSVDETAPISVTYGGNQIASISDGESKTLNCDGLYMTGNVVVGSKTMNCANTVMVSDVVISVKGSASSGGETWKFNDIIELSATTTYNVNFTSKDLTFVRISITKSFFETIRYEQTNSKVLTAYFNRNWLDIAFKTIVLEEPASGDFLTWLQANATKIS